MVKAIRVHEAGGPDVLKYEDVDLPDPAVGELQVEHAAIGINFVDVYFRTALYPPPSWPFIAGGEAAGTVTKVGKGVSGFRVGDRIAYVSSFGSYAEAANVPVGTVVKLPKSISFEMAAGMMVKGMTAEYLLRRTYKVKEGDIVLVHAAAGGVGLILCQWAKALGATVIGTVGSEDKAKLAKNNGARHVILYREEDFVNRVAEITKGKKCVGKATYPASLDCLAPFGTFVSFGNASGPVAAFNLALLSQKGSLYATRPTLGSYTDQAGGMAQIAKHLFNAVDKGWVKIKVSQRFPLAQAAEAHRALESRATTGSLLLIP
jgi:NADPH2:quinone reductase